MTATRTTSFALERGGPTAPLGGGVDGCRPSGGLQGAAQRSITGFLLIHFRLSPRSILLRLGGFRPDKVKALWSAWTQGGIPHRILVLKYIQ